MTTQNSAKDEAYDPYAPIETSPRFAHAYAAAALLLGVVSVVGLVAPFSGPIGMALGLVAHVKGSRFGMPSTVIAGVGMIMGMSLTMYLR